jgi:hypothetical protein
MEEVTGTLSIKHGNIFYSAKFERNGWIAAELIQYLDDLYRSDSLQVGILKLLGYTLQMTDSFPRREADHWVEIDIQTRTLTTNSELIRKAVRQETAAKDEPYWDPALERIYTVLDAEDFTVKLIY